MQRVRSIFVLFVAVLLLCGAPLAAVCGTVCNQASASCASATAGHAMQCEHCCKQAAWNTQHCAPMACAPLALLRDRQEDHFLRVQVQPLAVTAQAVLFEPVPGVSSWHAEPPKTSPVFLSSLVPLRI